MVWPDEELTAIVEATTGRPMEPASVPTAAEEADMRERVRRRAAGEPLPYVTGGIRFRTLDLAIGPEAFIPRPGSSIVVDRALAALPGGGVFADLCTGCGAIALAVASERPDATVWASDISPAALAWAERNRDASGLDVTLVRGDLFDAFPAALRTHVDVVVANPPHVPMVGEHFLPRDVLEHEPAEALFSGPDGLGLAVRLVEESVEWLRPGGWLVCEAGDSQTDRVSHELRKAGYLEVDVHPDDTGRRRAVEGRRPPR